MSGAKNQSLSIHPDELKFHFELEKQICCELKVANKTDQHVAFKVKTTSPKKYFVRPNTGVIQPWDSCVVKVTLQAQQDYPPDMQSKDKFLLQSTKVPPQTDIDELPPDTFNKDSGRTIEDCKLRVVYIFPQSGSTTAEDGRKQSSDTSNMQGSATNDDNKVLQRLRDERDAAVQQTQQLQRDLDMLKKRRSRRNGPGFSLRFAFSVALTGIMVGLLLNLSLSSPPTPPPRLDPMPSTPPTDPISSTPPAEPTPSTPPTKPISFAPPTDSLPPQPPTDPIPHSVM